MDTTLLGNLVAYSAQVALLVAGGGGACRTGSR